MNTSNIREQVIRLIHEAGFFIEPDMANIHLFNDVVIDSLAFVTLLVKIEEIYSIQFDITQMEACTELDRLLELIDRKLEENGHD